MKITQAILDNLTEQAKASPRLRINLDLRNSSEDQSQRMLNAIEPGSVLPIDLRSSLDATRQCSNEIRHCARCSLGSSPSEDFRDCGLSPWSTGVGIL